MVKTRPRLSPKLVLLLLILHGVGLIAAVVSVPQLTEWFSQASQAAPEVRVDTSIVVGNSAQPWQYLAQGGEAPAYSFGRVREPLTTLAPKMVRLDHVLNGYDVVSRDSNGQLIYRFEKLDRVLRDIKLVGAIPFISVSYMPPALSQGDVTDLPRHWSEWQQAVTKLVEHVSGTQAWGFDGVYYEVWNEPDLFGDFKTYGTKNYLDLYRVTTRGILAAQNTKPYKVGGPATTALYANWISALCAQSTREGLPLDFLSWHRYSKDPLALYEDGVGVRRQLANLTCGNPELVISEWGPDSGLDEINDNRAGGAHLLASSLSMGSVIDKAFIFEVEDGLAPNGRALWGRWGVLTHRDVGGQPKPRFHAITLLNQLKNEQLLTQTTQPWLYARFTNDTTDRLSKTTNLFGVVARYHPRSTQTLVVPVTIKVEKPGNFRILETNIDGITSEQRVATTAATLQLPLRLAPYDGVLLQVIGLD